MKNFIFIICLALSSCGYSEHVSYREVTQDKDKEKMQQWVADCIENANPKSDEEPEDWISQCEKTGIRMFGTLSVGITFAEDNNFVAFVPYEQCSERQKKIVDNYKNTGK